MSKKLTIGTSQLTGKIYAGHLIKGGTIWGANKQDVTIDCLVATIEHCLKFGKTVELCDSKGNVDFEIDVKDLRLIK